MSESSARSVTLEDDDPRIVRAMLEYFYSFNYTSIPSPDREMVDFEFHAFMYGIGEKYEVMKLKS